jgi:hypothetical protein
MKYGVWLPFHGDGRPWLQDVEGRDLVTDKAHAEELARLEYHDHVATAAPYNAGHCFAMWDRCKACKASLAQTKGRWCPHSNPPVELETAGLARKIWESFDAVAALCVEAGEGREPTPELLDRLFERDAKGFRSHAEAIARYVVSGV